MRTQRILNSAVMISLLVAGAMAQSSKEGKRAENQQDRIAQGVKSGQLTAGETSKLEKKESSIHKEVKSDRALNGGMMTKQERAVVNQQQNKVSKQVYNDKHNAATQHYGNNEVDARRQNQQQRIANGIASGKMNAAEASKVEKHEAAINQETRVDRTINGGKLTTGEKKQINQQQNGVSKKIYQDKHN
jgi:hypothetical protein